MIKNRLALAALLAATVALSAPANATTVVSLSNLTSANQFLDLDLGINFTVTAPVTINKLGAFTNGNSAIAVTLYKLTSVTTGSAIAAASVAGAPDAGSNYAFTAIAPITLGPGLYQINARYIDPANGNYNPNSGNTATVLFNTYGGKLAFAGSYYNYTGTNSIATTLDGVSQLSYGAGTFNAVPEPQTWALLVLGFGMVGIAARRRKATVSA